MVLDFVSLVHACLHHKICEAGFARPDPDACLVLASAMCLWAKRVCMSEMHKPCDAKCLSPNLPWIALDCVSLCRSCLTLQIQPPSMLGCRIHFARLCEANKVVALF